jgi:hypothetical protein
MIADFLSQLANVQTIKCGQYLAWPSPLGIVQPFLKVMESYEH